MNDEQMIKIKNFDYLNQNVLKGKILFTGSSALTSNCAIFVKLQEVKDLMR